MGFQEASIKKEWRSRSVKTYLFIFSLFFRQFALQIILSLLFSSNVIFSFELCTKDPSGLSHVTSVAQGTTHFFLVAVFCNACILKYITFLRVQSCIEKVSKGIDDL